MVTNLRLSCVVPFLLTWVLAYSPLPGQSDATKAVINLAGLYPLVSRWETTQLMAGPGVLPAVRLALQLVNADPGVLPQYELEIELNDTQCDMAVGTKLFFDLMHNPPAKVMLFGDACSDVTAPIAESAPYWNIWQLSYADTNPVLSDRMKYPNFFRTVPSYTDHNPARLKILEFFDWSRVGTLFQDASKDGSGHDYSHNRLTDLLDLNAIDRETESFSLDPKPALTKLKEKDTRIIIGNFGEDVARKVFCAAREQHMYGAKYAWIIPGSYSSGWWASQDPDIGCTAEELLEVLQGCIGTDILELSTSGRKTIANITADEYRSRYETSRMENDVSYSKFHGYAFDGIWVISKAIDSIIKQRQGVFDIEDFRSEVLHAALNDTNFEGVTGTVRFQNGDRIGGIDIKQFQGDSMIKIGEFDAHSYKLDFDKGNAIVWPGTSGLPPRDKTITIMELHKVNSTVYAVMCTFAGLGILLAVLFLTTNIHCRNHRYIKMSSPTMNNLIIQGCIMFYLSVFLLGINGSLLSDSGYAVMCSVRTITMCVGFTLSFGAMFSKTWRVHAIFTNIKLNKKVIKDSKLLLLVALLLTIDIILLAAWQAIDPPRRETKNLQTEIDPLGGDKEIVPVIEFCISDHMTIWMIAIYVYKGLLLLFGCFLAWETRHVSIAALNDSKYIGMSVYNVVIMCVAGVPVSFIISDQPNSAYLIIALFILFSTTITLCLVFVPKMIELKRDPKGDEKRIRATLRKNGKKDGHQADMTHKIRNLSEENFRYRQILENRKLEVIELLEQLGDEVYRPEEMNRSPVHRTLLALRPDGVFQRVAGHSSTGSEATLYSDDDSSVVSSASSANAGQFDARLTDCRPSLPRNDHIQMRKMPKAKYHRHKVVIHASNNHAPPPINSLLAENPTLSGDSSVHARSVSTLDTVLGNRDDHRMQESVRNDRRFSTGTRTPSYQGLKFLGDIFSLKETEILSDSEGSAQASSHSLPGSTNPHNLSKIFNFQHLQSYKLLAYLIT